LKTRNSGRIHPKSGRIRFSAHEVTRAKVTVLLLKRVDSSRAEAEILEKTREVRDALKERLNDYL